MFTFVSGSLALSKRQQSLSSFEMTASSAAILRAMGLFSSRPDTGGLMWMISCIGGGRNCKVLRSLFTRPALDEPCEGAPSEGRSQTRTPSSRAGKLADTLLLPHLGGATEPDVHSLISCDKCYRRSALQSSEPPRLRIPWIAFTQTPRSVSVRLKALGTAATFRSATCRSKLPRTWERDVSKTAFRYSCNIGRTRTWIGWKEVFRKGVTIDSWEEKVEKV